MINERQHACTFSSLNYMVEDLKGALADWMVPDRFAVCVAGESAWYLVSRTSTALSIDCKSPWRVFRQENGEIDRQWSCSADHNYRTFWGIATMVRAIEEYELPSAV